MRFLLTLLLVLLSSICFSQKTPLSHLQFDEWNTLKSVHISDNGEWITYEINPYRGDGKSVLLNTQTQQSDTIFRAYDMFIGRENRFFTAKIKPQFDTLRKLELDKVKKEKLPKDTLWVSVVEQDTTYLIPNLLHVKVSENSYFISYLTDKNEIPSTDSKKKKKVFFKFLKRKEKNVDKYTSDGHLLTIWNPISGTKKQFIDVKDVHVSDSGNYVSFVTHQKRDKNEIYNLDIHHFTDASKNQFLGPFTAVGDLAWNETESKFAFLASRDTVKNNKHFELYLIDLESDLPQLKIDSLFAGMPTNQSVSEHGKLHFAKDGNRLFFGTALLPKREGKDTLTESEKAKLDIWNWQDGELQPQQLKNLKRKQNESFLSFYDWEKKQFKILENDSIRVRFDDRRQTQHFIGSSDKPYVQQAGWSFPWKQDYYSVDIDKSEPELILEGFDGRVHFSPDGNQLVYFNPKKKEYVLRDMTTGTTHCLTCGFVANWLEDNNGQPHELHAINRVYWEKGKTHVWLQAEDDLYRVRYNGSSFRCITDEIGASYKQDYRIVKWDSDSSYYDPERIWLIAQDSKTKTERIFTLDSEWNVQQKITVDAHVLSLEKAKNSNHILYRKSTVADYPDYWLTNINFDQEQKITTTNPQQINYNWANVQLVEWKTPLGKELQGLLYTPEDLDTTKSYPMLVYFYELNSENLHRHWVPKPTASIIFPTEYASSGYVVFIPDVRYEIGKPAASAYDCILSGTDYVLHQFPFIDSTRMGLQGQSWGGYQTAQLITMTTRFKAGMAGAPVSNMFSAYGGIRWGSGFSRMFQYEHTQSRIGATIWEKPELYYENSPLFGLPKVETPLLIMHNDQDGAVPWYQGIELFMGLRRLNKPVWLLNYNGDDHNLMKEANRRDLSIRMKQFFDHYLMNQPAPKWMTEGIPAHEKVGLNH
jgi:dipeptidyl aminopeptidase/acylaminoacyl peptidase